jgi:hypothetical protein
VGSRGCFVGAGGGTSGLAVGCRARQRGPHSAIVSFADAVYDAAVETAGWPADLVGPRFDGWHASRTAPAATRP